MKKRICIIAVIFALMATLTLSACDKFTNPGDNLGGGGTGEVAVAVDTTELEAVRNEIKSRAELTEDNLNTDATDAKKIEPTTDVVEISKGGAYLFEGEYGAIKYTNTDKKNVHLIFKNASFTNENGIAIDCQENKVKSLTITLVEGTTNTVTNKGKGNAIHVKGGELVINGTGTLTVTSESNNALKCSKEIKIVDATLNVSAANHAISGASVIASNCTVNVTAAGKDGINAECDEATEFRTSDGYVKLTDVNYTCDVTDDGIQANTAVYLNGGVYNVKSVGKGVKVSEIEYEDEDKDTVTVTNGNYLIAVDNGTFTFNCTDDAIHASSGSVLIAGGSFTISTGDDAVTADRLVKISGGNVAVTNSYEGIEGAYVEISGGTVSIKSSDDGINAASNKRAVTPHIIVSGGCVTVDSGGDGLDSNGSILISGGTVVVHGPTTGGDAGLDADKGIVVNGGVLFATSTLGMVETPATNSTQFVISYAQNSAIAVGTKISLRDNKGNVLIEFEVMKSKCQSIILSHPDLKKNTKYSIYSDDTKLETFKISSIITSIGVSTQGRFPGGPGGPGPRR